MFINLISLLIVAGSFTVLITWVEKKKTDFLSLSSDAQEEERKKAYGGAGKRK